MAQEGGANLKEGGREVRSDSPGVLEAIETDLGKSHQARSSWPKSCCPDLDVKQKQMFWFGVAPFDVSLMALDII